MDLERKKIQKRDFATARRGYDPQEVDAHLAEIADAIEELRTTSTAGAAAQRVQAIVEAAEKSAVQIEEAAQQDASDRREQAAEIRKAAEEQAEKVRKRAEQQAKASRDRIEADAAEGLTRASEAERLLEDAASQLDSLRGALGKLRGTLESPHAPAPAEAEAEGDEVEAEKAPPEEAEAAAEPAEAEKAKAVKADQAKAQQQKAAKNGEAKAEPEAETAHAEPPKTDKPVKESQETRSQAAYKASPGSAPKRTGQPRDGAEGARLIALNMALDGTSREETDRYLAENFKLSDRDGLLDEVYESVNG
jgi:DivIVA domain-containing protein